MFQHSPNTPEGVEERRLADAERKRNQREAAAAVARQMVEPAPLPPATPRAPGPNAPAADGPGAVPPGPDGPFVPETLPWEPELIADLLTELIDAAEENRVAQYVAQCKEAKLLPKLCKEIEDDAYFPKLSKKVLSRSLPRLAAKYLNKTGVSAEFQDEVATFTAVLLILWSDRQLAKRLAEHTDKAKQIAEPPKPAAPAPTSETKPPATPAVKGKDDALSIG